MKTRKQKGFSLIELLVVVAILLIIAGIAIPRLLAARTAAVESAAGSTMRTVNTALMGYNSKFGVWPADLKSLGGVACDTTAPTTSAACMLDNAVSNNLASGLGQYIFTYSTAAGAFQLNADPVSNSAAKRHYFSDAGLAVHYNDTTAAAAVDPTIGN